MPIFSLVLAIRRWSSAPELGIELFYGVPVVQRIKKNVGIKDMRKENGRKAYCVWREVDACLVCSFEDVIFHVSLCFFL